MFSDICLIGPIHKRTFCYRAFNRCNWKMNLCETNMNGRLTDKEYVPNVKQIDANFIWSVHERIPSEKTFCKRKAVLHSFVVRSSFLCSSYLDWKLHKKVFQSSICSIHNNASILLLKLTTELFHNIGFDI